ncbi:hypothetical protein DV096_00720 [Bradymonadaceae bacterium TMQ3]|uniref:DedA family protein n=1 Tax=Lujinxingia sediminis TaxID=2480984 RepID=A0ABY0CY68_9DELT|nr:hypothetical protein [Lujinxingia sediminis]RDV39128.1 hypothetical protein DV096_00720 [Bradymonadaceae bacterium TMQ3]RVU48827.1 hypothetical protein EA187_05205 [Lujinxingia sediminis]TXC78120.1 hypothetical protein FRC91_05170 [Bradymonadales bacterium TMQ1]
MPEPAPQPEPGREETDSASLSRPERTRKQVAIFLVALLLVVGWTFFFLYTEPEAVIEWMGVENSYLVGFLISVFGALGSVTPFSTYPAVYAMATTEVNLIILIPLVAVGLTVGDALFFYFGVTAQSVMPQWLENWMERVWLWLQTKPELFLQIFIFLYVGFSPFANNLLTAPLAMAGYRFRKIVVPLTLGNCSLPIVASYLATINA